MGKIKIGWSEVSITQKKKASLAGQFFERISEYVETPITVTAMAEYLGVTERCVRDRLREAKDTYWVKSGTVGMHGKKENTEN